MSDGNTFWTEAIEEQQEVADDTFARLEEVRLRLGISTGSLEAFLQLEQTRYAEIEFGGATEVRDQFTVSDLMRLCVLLELSPAMFFGSEGRSGQVRQIDYAHNNEGHRDISKTLRELLGDSIHNEAATGWEGKALATWLSSDEDMGNMPLPAFTDVCKLLEIDPIGVLNAMLGNLGRGVNVGQILETNL